ncbi:MAG: Gfo/Idh/MocA family protein [Elusimicrobiota bacterium]
MAFELLRARRAWRGALAGFGFAAERSHAPAFARFPSLTIVAVADPSPSRRRAAAAVFPGVALYADLEELMAAEENLDFVDIATPPFLHAEQVLAALGRGAHVLCEKPLAVNERYLERIQNEAATRGKIVWTAHNWAYAPQWTRLRAAAAVDRIGQARKMEIEVLRSGPAASAGAPQLRAGPASAGGGILVDHGWHALYLIHGIFGVLPKVDARRFSRALGAEDEIFLHLSSDRCSAELFLSWKAPERSNRITIEGDGGRLVLRDDVLTIETGGSEAVVERFPQKLSRSSAHPEWFLAMLQDFESALARPDLARTNQEEAAFCCRTIAAAYGAPVLGSAPR